LLNSYGDPGKSGGKADCRQGGLPPRWIAAKVAKHHKINFISSFPQLRTITAAELAIYLATSNYSRTVISWPHAGNGRYDLTVPCLEVTGGTARVRHESPCLCHRGE
jgi:hypothetical protein